MMRPHSGQERCSGSTLDVFLSERREEKRMQTSTTVVQAPEDGSEWPSTHQQIRQEELSMILGPVLTALGIYSA